MSSSCRRASAGAANGSGQRMKESCAWGNRGVGKVTGEEREK
jgi:hypothetical protein